jgi:hypothetical protein
MGDPKQFRIKSFNEIVKKFENRRLNKDDYKKPPKFILCYVPNNLKNLIA